MITFADRDTPVRWQNSYSNTDPIFYFRDDSASASDDIRSSITCELQDDGSYIWYAVDPVTNERVRIDPEQAWFWTPEWQAREREADDDLREGRYQIVDDLDDFFNNL